MSFGIIMPRRSGLGGYQGSDLRAGWPDYVVEGDEGEGEAGLISVQDRPRMAFP